MLLGLPFLRLFSAVTLLVGPVQTFTFSVTPSPVDVGQAYEIVWDYVEGDAPDNSFAIEVQGEDGYLQWFGFFNSSGSTPAPALPSVGFYTLAAYNNVPGIDNGTFYTTLFDAQESTTSMSNSEITKTSHSSTNSQSTTISVQTSSVLLSSSPLLSSFSPTTTTPQGPSTLFTSSFTLSSSFGSLPSSSTSSSSSSTTPLNSSSPEPPSNSTLSKPKRNTIIISVFTSAGGLIFFALFGFYCIRRRRRLRDIENKELAATPYAYSQYAFRAGPTFGPSPSSSRTRIPPSKRSAPTASDDGHLPLNRNARNMRRLYDDTSPPTYISIVA